MYTHTHTAGFFVAIKREEYLLMFALHRLFCPCEKTMGPPESLVSLLYTFSKSFLWTTNFNMASALTLLYTPHVGCCEPHGRSCSYTIYVHREKKLSVVCCPWWGIFFRLFFFFFPPKSFPFLVDSLSPAEKVAVGVLSSRWLPKKNIRVSFLSLKRENSFL